MSNAQLSGSPKTIHVKKGGRSESLHYAPLTYGQRGELELIYKPHSRTPSERLEELLESMTPDQLEARGGEGWAAKMRSNAEKASRGYEVSLEDGHAELLFLQNVGRPGGDDTDYRVEFLRVALGAKHGGLSPEQFAEYLGLVTKSQLQDIWNWCLEVGPYRPKSDLDPAAGL